MKLAQTTCCLLWLAGCEQYAAPAVTVESTQHEATSESRQSKVRDDPSKCVDSPAPYREPDMRGEVAVMKIISELGECARNLAAPSNVMVEVHFRTDGTVEKVDVLRADTDTCSALECVRQRLFKARAPIIDKGERRVGADFTLRARPAPDGYEHVNWSLRPESKRCTDAVESDALEPGGRSPDQIQAIVRASYDDLRVCYNAGLRSAPDLRGRVVAKVFVSAQGNVSSVNITDNQLPDCAVVECVRHRMINLHFPAAPKPTTFVYPFEFEPG